MLNVHFALFVTSAIGVSVCFLLGLGLGRRARSTAARIALCVIGIAIVLVAYAGVQAIVGDPLLRLLAGIDTSFGKTPYVVYWVFGGLVAWVAYCLAVFRRGTNAMA